MRLRLQSPVKFKSVTVNSAFPRPLTGAWFYVHQQPQARGDRHDHAGIRKRDPATIHWHAHSWSVPAAPKAWGRGIWRGVMCSASPASCLHHPRFLIIYLFNWEYGRRVFTTCLLSYDETRELVASPLSTTGPAAEFPHAERTTFGVD